MCGRYTFDHDEDLAKVRVIQTYIQQRFGEARAAELKTGEIFPTNEVPILLTAEADPLAEPPAAARAASLDRHGAEDLIAIPMVWGFPGFKGSQVLINARQETVAEKQTFSESFAMRRCVIPTTGFIEWSHDARDKAVDKFRFNAGDDRMLYLAGIYTWHEDELRFVILTTDANESMASVHNRQPVILDSGMIRPWIMDLNAAEELKQLPGPEMVRSLI